MRRDPGKEPVEGDVLEGVRGERRTVLAVCLVDRHTVVTYKGPAQAMSQTKEATLDAWGRWVAEHEAHMVKPEE